MAALKPELQFWLAGTGDLHEPLLHQAAERELSNVWFFGRVPPSVLPQLTQRATLGYALMDGHSLNYRLSLSNKSIDYLHAGLPSLQMNWQEYKAIASQYGGYILLDTLEPSEIVAAIESTLDTERYASLVAGCRSASAALTWDREEAALLEVWQPVLATSLAP